MALVQISDVSFAYLTEAVVSHVNLTVENGEIVALVGPSGCGKSTLLRLIAGLEVPTSGQITVGGSVAGHNRDVLRFLFQDYDAYPWFTVWENVKKGSGTSPHPSDKAVREILRHLELGTETTLYPGELSGGMSKRLALARCLIRGPSLLLLDEPFSSLDVNLKYQMYRLVQHLWSDTKCAVMLVTHDLQEAIWLADRILVLGDRPLHIRETIEVLAPRPREEDFAETDHYHALLSRLVGLFRPARG